MAIFDLHIDGFVVSFFASDFELQGAPPKMAMSDSALALGQSRTLFKFRLHPKFNKTVEKMAAVSDRWLNVFAASTVVSAFDPKRTC